jgi:hypothetical protein
VTTVRPSGSRRASRPAAARWLADAFGFESPNPLPDDEQGGRWIEQHGFRSYVAVDLEGHGWTFAQARPTMD